jgi:cell division ATPase FtsA
MVWRRKAGSKREVSSAGPVYYSVVEPGTTTLRCLVVGVHGGQATVWGWSERSRWAGLDTDLDVERLVDTCEDLLAQAETMAQERAGRWLMADQILVGLPAAQLRGRAGSVTQRRSRPDRPVEERELVALLGRALRLAINRLSDPGDPSWLLVDAVPVSLTVNGRGVTDPVGFRADEIGATVFVALAQMDVVAAWRSVARALEFSTLILTAAPLALAAGLSQSQGLTLDVGGTTTDLTWWRAGRPVALESLPIGGESFTTLLIRRWHLSHERAERLKQAYASGRLGEDGKAQVSEVLSLGVQAWLAETEAALARLNQDELLPEWLYLLGGGALLPSVVETARSLAWSEKLNFVRYPQVARLRPTDIPGVVNRTELGRGAGDVPALALAAWAARQSRPPGQAPDRAERVLSELCDV